MKQEAMATKTAIDIDRYAVHSCRVNDDSGNNGTQSRNHSSGKRQRCPAEAAVEVTVVMRDM